ncbi:MAG: DUF962 domain-containing protein [Pseudomonadota bacterium]
MTHVETKRTHQPLPDGLTDYEEFFGYYLREHRKPSTRRVHAAGTVLGTALLVAAIATSNWALIPLGVVVGYGFAWVSHFFVERNKPAAFKYPFWSFISDYRMVYLMVTGKIGQSLEKAGVSGS